MVESWGTASYPLGSLALFVCPLIKLHLPFHCSDIYLSCAEYTAPAWPYPTGLTFPSWLRNCRTAFPGQPTPSSCSPAHPLMGAHKEENQE